MIDTILQTLQSQAAPELMKKFGLDQKQASGSVNAAADSVKEVLAGKGGFGMDTMLNLFSSAQNNPKANDLLSNIGQVFSGKLTSQVGLDAAKANGVKETLLPMVTKLLTDKVGGNAAAMHGLLGAMGGSGGIANVAKGFLGKLFK